MEISNDDPFPVHVECYYVNDAKGRRGFDFFMNPEQTISWDVLTGNGTFPGIAQFPTDGTFPGNPNVGELICFAVDDAGSVQIKFNHLSGNATVVVLDDADAFNHTQAFDYNAWSFTARATNPLNPPPDGTPVGTPGELVLSGGGDGTYDACPAYLIANFSPGGASLDGVTTLDNDLSVSVCNQDLRQDFNLHLTKLEFTVWNEREVSFSGSYQCSDSTFNFGLDPQDQPPFGFPFPGPTVGAENFTFATLGTNNARFQVKGVASSQCVFVSPQPPLPPIIVPSENTGLVGVLNTSLQIGTDPGESAEAGTTLDAAGLETGFVLWDPAAQVVPETNKGKKHK